MHTTTHEDHLEIPSPSDRLPSMVQATRSALARASLRCDHSCKSSLLARLQEMEPSEPRWPHKLGDTLSKLRRGEEAAEAYRRAAELYAEHGRVNRALAVLLAAER